MSAISYLENFIKLEVTDSKKKAEHRRIVAFELWC